MNVRAAVAHEGRSSFSIEELEMSEPGPDNILVRMAGCGLCHTDVKAREGTMGVPMPAVLGHEGAGIVERVGERVTKVKPGDYVVLTGDSCGACPTCLAGDPAYCDRMSPLNFMDGRAGEPGSFQKGGLAIHGHFFGQSSFADYAVTGERNTIPVRKDAPLEILGVLGCGVQTGAGAIMNSLHPPGGSSVAIFGAGSVGLSAVMGAVVRGCSAIIAVDVLESRLAMARQVGATHTVLAGPQVKVAEEIRKAVPSGVGYAFDTTGRADSNQQALESLAAKGCFGFCAVPAEAPKMSRVMIRGLSIRGIVQGDSVPDTFIPYLVELHMDGRFPFDKLVTKYPFEKMNQAIEDQAAGKVVKPVFTFASLDHTP
ncbi:MAG TPA: NAD(P)-dependent alcohol dehydrogenase [Candidatus Acidoferrales bacterium]|nr:NAD(P)-dependent alcohol dehydrogenase [Candidatus Acidoferrales bacterium]